jgi:hypothetical protein
MYRHTAAKKDPRLIDYCLYDSYRQTTVELVSYEGVVRGKSNRVVAACPICSSSQYQCS